MTRRFSNNARSRASYPISPCSLREQISDGYKLIFHVALFGGIANVYLWGHGAWSSAAVGAWLRTLPSLRLGARCRPRLESGSDWHVVAAYLGRTGHVERERGWTPPLPGWLYFETQVVRHDGAFVLGPYLTLRRVRSKLLERDR